MTNAELGILLEAKDHASGVFSDVKKAALGLAVTFVAAAGEAIKAAEEEQVTMTRLYQAVSNAGDGFEVASSRIDDFITLQRAVSGFSRGELADSLALITAQTGSYAEATSRLHYAEDIARGTHMDLYAASKLVGKVTEENVKVFARMGIVVKKGTTETELFNLIQAKFGGQSAAYAATAEGQWAIFLDSLHQLFAFAGSVVLPILTQGIGIATEFVQSLQGGGRLQEIGDAWGKVSGAVGDMFGVITGNAPGAGAMLKNAVGEGPAIVIMQFLGLIRDDFRAVLAGDIPALLTNFRTRIGTIGGELVTWIGQQAPIIRDRLLQWAREFVAWVGPASLRMLQDLLHLLSDGLHWIADHSDEIGDALVEWGKKFGEFIFTVAIPAFIEYAPQLVGTIIHWALFDALPALVTTFWNIGKKIIGAIADAFGSSVRDIFDAISYALHQAFNMIDFWVGPFHVTGHGITVQMPELHFPGFAEGGTVAKTGLALVHAGEEIIPAAAAGSGGSGGGGGGGVEIHFHGPVYGMNDFKQVVRQVVRDTSIVGGFRGTSLG